MRLATSLLCALGLAACGAAGAETVLVSAASDLAGALPELTAAFEAEHGRRVVATIGASGMLAQQVIKGAPVDVFMSADRTWVERVIAEGHADAATRTIYAEGTLTLVSADHAEPARDVAALADAHYARIAIANPQHAPYGRAAREALQGAGVWDTVRSRLVLAENVRQAYEYVASGNVDAALVARSLVRAGAVHADVPRTLYEPLLQEAVVVAGAADPGAASAFVAFLQSDVAREILRRHSFTLPPR